MRHLTSTAVIGRELFKDVAGEMWDPDNGVGVGVNHDEVWLLIKGCG